MTGRLLLCALAAMAITGCRESPDAAVGMSTPAPDAVLPKYFPLPEFSLIERSGQPLHLADLAGKVWVADFFYTTCPGPCPMLSSRLSDVQTALGEAPDVRLLSISVDPEKDTPEVLKQYAQKFQASARWLFATGDKAHIYDLARRGFKLPLAEPATDGEMITHSTRLVLVDRTGTVRGFYEGGAEASVGELVRDIGKLLAEK